MISTLSSPQCQSIHALSLFSSCPVISIDSTVYLHSGFLRLCDSDSLNHLKIKRLEESEKVWNPIYWWLRDMLNHVNVKLSLAPLMDHRSSFMDLWLITDRMFWSGIVLALRGSSSRLSLLCYNSLGHNISHNQSIQVDSSCSTWASLFIRFLIILPSYLS